MLTYTAKYSASLFSDAGATLFCGPFTIEDRIWISKSIAEIGVEKGEKKLNPNQFMRDSVSYFPGFAYLSSIDENVKIEQQFFL